MFDNATSYVVYAKDILQVAYMNKKPKGQQPFLQTNWYKGVGGEIIIQEIYTLSENSATS